MVRTSSDLCAVALSNAGMNLVLGPSPGRYDIHVSADAFEEMDAVVQVERDGCHPITEEVVMTLEDEV